MKNENILDDSFNELPPQNKWKLAFISIAILSTLLSITMLSQKYIPIIFATYTSMVIALYFFIKRINYKEITLRELFLWGTFIIFGGNF